MVENLSAIPRRFATIPHALQAPSRLLLFGLVLIHTAGYLLWYSGTPLGLYPVLDGREMLALARQIASGELPHEPFYRAPLYPALLAVPIKLGLPVNELPIFARLLNGLFHVTSTLLVWSIARAVWQRAACAFVAAGLFGFNPVVLHFAGDPLDIGLAMMLMLSGLRVAIASQTAKSVTIRCLLVGVTGVLLASAALARPHMLSLVVLWPVIQACGRRRLTRRLAYVLAAAVPAAAMLSGLGIVNHRISGDFQILPWQGAYNLWSANKTGAHGRYFEQLTPIHSYSEQSNAARLESERLYKRDNPGVAAPDHDQISAYWRARTVDRVISEPLSWLKQMAGKLYYLTNNFEQYNNKTYAMHKARSPWLAPNPIGWSLLLILAAIGAAFAWQSATMRLIALCAVTYAAGVLLFYVSARFRLPLVPLLAISAGVVGNLKAQFETHTIGQVVLILAAAAMLGTISLIPIPESEQQKTYVQDYLALSRAASQIGAHDQALRFARRAASYDGEMDSVIDMLCIAGFNSWLHARTSDRTRPVPEDLYIDCGRAARFSDPAARLLGILYWQSGRHENAVALWQAAIDGGSTERENLLSALLMTGNSRAVDVAYIASVRYTEMSDALLLALALSGDEQAHQELTGRFTETELEIQLTALHRLFEVSD